MSYQAGGIRYDIEVSTVELLKAEMAVDKSVSKQTKSFLEIDRIVRNFEKTQRDLGRTIGETGIIFDRQGKVLVEQTNQYRAMTANAMKAHDSIGSLGGGISKTADGVRRANIDMTNMSYQLQDIAVQAQMGINPFMIAAQQIPQMLVGMGAAAAGIGAVVAVLGGLAMAFIDTSTNADKLAKSIENIKASITLGAGGLVTYTEEMERLGEISELVLGFKLQLLAVKAKESLGTTKDAIADVMDEFDDGTMMDFGDAMKYSSQIMADRFGEIAKYAKNLGVALGASGDEAKKLGKEFIEIIKAIETVDSVEEIDNLQIQLVKLVNQTGKASPELKKLVGEIFPLLDAARQSAAAMEVASGKTKALTGDAVAASNAFENMGQSMKAQLIELEEGSRAALEHSLILAKMDETQRKAILADYDKIQAIKAQRDEFARLNDEVEWFNEEMEQVAEQEAKRKEALAQRGQFIGLDENERFKLQQTQQHEILKQMLEEKLITEDEYLQRRNNLYKEADNELSVSFEALTNQAVGAFTQFVTGAKSGKEAIHDLASSILTQMIGAIVKWGYAELTRIATVDTAEKASAAANAATTSASVGAQVAMMSALAAQNAFAATAAIPIVGPVAAPAAAAAAAAASGALGSAALALAPMAGARQYGGPVSNGKAYLVGERGPEMFVPNGNGQIVSNGDMGGSGEITVIVNNNAPAKAYATVDEVNRIVKVEISDLSNQVQNNTGPFYRSLTQATNVRGRNG